MDKRSYLSLLAASGLSLALFSMVFVLAFLAKAFTQGKLNVLYLLGFTVAAWVGVYVTRYALRAFAGLTTELAESGVIEVPAPKPRASLVGQIMLLARASKGRLSASEVAAATHLSVNESHQMLRTLVKQGIADIWLNNAGGVVYVFPELFEDFKETARSPLD